MKLKYYVASLLNYIEENPEANECTVVTSDNERRGNDSYTHVCGRSMNFYMVKIVNTDMIVIN